MGQSLEHFAFFNHSDNFWLPEIPFYPTEIPLARNHLFPQLCHVQGQMAGEQRITYRQIAMWFCLPSCNCRFITQIRRFYILKNLGLCRIMVKLLLLCCHSCHYKIALGLRSKMIEEKMNERETKEDFPLLSLSMGDLFSAPGLRTKGFLLRFSLSLPQFSFQYLWVY